ncbi:hypothetical protein [Glycomyces salinus]|nr:hypothetical protein [Glycomyces salinus]
MLYGPHAQDLGAYKTFDGARAALDLELTAVRDTPNALFCAS